MQQSIALVVAAAVLVLLLAALREALFTAQRDEFERAEDLRRRREAALLRVGVLMVALALVAGLLGGDSIGQGVRVSVAPELREELQEIAAANRDLAQSVAALRADLDTGLKIDAGDATEQLVVAIEQQTRTTAKRLDTVADRLGDSETSVRDAIAALEDALARLEIPSPLVDITLPPGSQPAARRRFQRVDLSDLLDLRVPFDSHADCDPRGSTADERRQVIDEVVAALRGFLEEGRLLRRVEVVGRFDHRPLTGAALGIYGGNTGLAQARADCVAALLGEALGDLSELAVDTRIAGPRNPAFRAEGDETVLARDRSARIVVYMLAPTDLQPLQREQP